MQITQKQRRQLKKLAHHLKPLVIVGQNGINENLIAELNRTLEHHELVKIRINAGSKPERQALLEAIVQQTDATLVQTIGHVAALFRRNPDKPKVDLPTERG